MRRLEKLAMPDVLHQNAQVWLDDYLNNKSSTHYRYKYRHSDIKNTLKAETNWKCVYCESKIGHNTPGDIEHKIPSSKAERLHFEWTNLTVACQECNRRKNDYLDLDKPFLDPYSDDVESLLDHHGPLVFCSADDHSGRAECTVSILELNDDSRAGLILQKKRVLQDAAVRIRQIKDTQCEHLKMVRQLALAKFCERSSEYSGCVRAFLQRSNHQSIIQIADSRSTEAEA